MDVVHAYWSCDFVALPPPPGLRIRHRVEVPDALATEALATPGLTSACERALVASGPCSPDGDSEPQPRRVLAFVN